MINQHNMTLSGVSGPFTLQSNISHSVKFYDDYGSLTFQQNGNIIFEGNCAGGVAIFMGMIRSNMNRQLKFMQIHDYLEIPLDDTEDIKLIYKKDNVPDSFYKLEKLISYIEKLKAFW